MRSQRFVVYYKGPDGTVIDQDFDNEFDYAAFVHARRADGTYKFVAIEWHEVAEDKD